MEIKGNSIKKQGKYGSVKKSVLRNLLSSAAAPLPIRSFVLPYVRNSSRPLIKPFTPRKNSDVTRLQ